MIVLGLNAFHGDSSACLVVDGKLVAAVEEERFTREKHWAGFPAMAINYCLRQARIQLGDVDIVAVNSNPGAVRYKKLAYLLSGKAGLPLIREKLLVRKKRASIQTHLKNTFPGEVFTGKIENVEHHLAHLASGFYCSPFKEAIVVSVDGFGDFSSCAWGVGTGDEIQVQGRIYFPHSLGIFYQAMTQFLGFPYYGDEYKVMGLAPYGKAHHLVSLEKVLEVQDDGHFGLNLDFFRHHREPAGFEWSSGSPVVSRLYSSDLEGLLGLAREPGTTLTTHHFDLAQSVQVMYERAFFNLLNHAAGQGNMRTLALAGGCAMNSVANGRIYKKTWFDRVYAQAAAGDAGGAVGAALFAAQKHRGLGIRKAVVRADFGPGFSLPDIERIVQKYGKRLAMDGIQVQTFKDPQLFDWVAGQLVRGSVIGWFQGRMEWGPRALGHRSILADPRRSDMKDILNRKIKKRESFRPFAPSILREHVNEWFETEDDVPFMSQVFQVREERREAIPAVTHVDGSGRLQTVSEDGNKRFYKLLCAFFKQTGVPVLLNTSFNENEPIVCEPEQAIDCFMRTNMDVLVLENTVLWRDEAGRSEG